MFRNLCFASCCAALLATAADVPRAPVLVELFTSEGCSSCPPADRLLQQLDSRVIVLSEHVDYWDHLGWKDRFSSHALTDRQEAYTRLFRLDGPYTPQMVVDGQAESSGNDPARVAEEIGKAEKRTKTEVRLARTAGSLQVDVAASASSADVMLALADDGAESAVARGENKGRNLRHVAVLRSLRKIGSVKRGGTFHGDIPLPAEGASQRAIVFVQEGGQSRILGAAVSMGK